MFIKHTDKAVWIPVILIPLRESLPSWSSLLFLLFGVYFGSVTSFEIFYLDVSARFRPLQVYLSCVQIFLLVAHLFMSLEGCHCIGLFKPFSVRSVVLQFRVFRFFCSLQDPVLPLSL
jgi:hypothetical protein